jgi:hypothetical protein
MREWACSYVLASDPDISPDYYVIDRHFQPLTMGETCNYIMGETPLLPQFVHNGAPYCGNGLLIPYYPLHLGDNLFIGKTDPQETKTLEVFKNGALIRNETKNWGQDPISIGDFLDAYGYGLYVFRVKADTTLDICSQNLAEYQINYTVSSSDLLPPVITRIECSPNFVNNTYPVEIELNDNQAIGDVSLHYSIDDDLWRSSSLMNLGNECYSTELGLSSEAQAVSLKIMARDENGNAMQFSTGPVARKGYRTHLSASLTQDRISGKLTVIGGGLLQPIYLKIKTNETEMYTLTDLEGGFEFLVPQSISFPIVIEMVDMGPYEGTSILINRTGVHDIAVIKILPFKNTVGQGFNLDFDVTIANKGDFTETFALAINANATSIISESVVLSSRDSLTLTFTWNTTSFAKGVYIISAYATPVPGETETADNVLTDGFVLVNTSGDLNDDGIVDIVDLVIVALAFGSQLGNDNWDPRADIAEPWDLIDIVDLILVALHLGEGA